MSKALGIQRQDSILAFKGLIPEVGGDHLNQANHNTSCKIRFENLIG